MGRDAVPPENAWSLLAKCNFLSVFDSIQQANRTVRSQRFHCGFNVRRPSPLSAYVCVRFTSSDDSTGYSTPVDVSVGEGGHYVGNYTRCFPIDQLDGLVASNWHVTEHAALHTAEATSLLM